MSGPAILPEPTQEQVTALGSVDIVVGIPSYNNAATIDGVVRMAQEGLHRHFASYRGLIVNSDGGSKDGTPQKVLEIPDSTHELLQLPYKVNPVQKLATPYHGIPGKGSAFRTIFHIAKTLGAKACAVFDADLRSMTPDWVKQLLAPILEHEYDFTAPYYTRHKFDGTITNSIVYPLTRSLYGKRIRQPIGGEFGFSARLLDSYLAQQDVWTSEVARFGIDIWVTTHAISRGFKICQAFLGAKIHDPKDPASDLSDMLVQVIGALFREMDRNAAIWQKVRGSEKVPIFGEVTPVNAEPVTVDVQKMIDSYRLGFQNLQEIWALFLPPATLLELKKIARASAGAFTFPDEVWVKTVYDFALGYKLRVINRDHLLRALTPLYLGWVASFVLQMQDAGPEEVERRIEKLCLTYETSKPYLISRWRWPDKFNP